MHSDILYGIIQYDTTQSESLVRHPTYVVSVHRMTGCVNPTIEQAWLMVKRTTSEVQWIDTRLRWKAIREQSVEPYRW